MSYIIVDSEVGGLNPYKAPLRLCGYQYNNIYQDVVFPDTASDLRDLLANHDIVKVFHNAKFDIAVLEANGFHVSDPIIDTYLLAKLYKNDYPSYDLKSLVYYIFGDEMLYDRKLDAWFKSQKTPMTKKDILSAPLELLREYCKGDVHATDILYHYYIDHIEHTPLMDYMVSMEMGVIRIVLDIERTGICIDKPYYITYRDAAKVEMKEIKKDTGFNPLSPKQVGKYISSHFDSIITNEATGNVKTGEDIIEKLLPDPVIEKVLRARKLNKNAETYIKNILTASSVDGRIHPNFNQSLAITRRFSASNLFGPDPNPQKGNLQNFPPTIRQGIVAPEGYMFGKLDLNQIEARLFAHLASSLGITDTWAEKYRTDPEFNMYVYIASICEGVDITKEDPVYKKWKARTLGKQYGLGAKKAAAREGISPHEVYRQFGVLDQSVPMLQQVIDRMTGTALRYGYIKDDFGLVYHIHPDKPYKAVNYYCQGLAGVIFKLWLLKVYEIAGHFDEDVPINLVHDEIDMYIHDDNDKERRCQAYCDAAMTVGKFTVPIVADYMLGRNWRECG